MQRMKASELAQYLTTSKPLLVDVREPWEFEICQLADSINIPMATIPNNLQPIQAADECVIICHHGVRSMNVIRYLMQQDIEHLINLDGGVDAWAQAVDRDMALY